MDHSFTDGGIAEAQHLQQERIGRGVQHTQAGHIGGLVRSCARSRAASHGKVGERAIAKMKIVIKVNLRELVAIAAKSTREKYCEICM